MSDGILETFKRSIHSAPHFVKRTVRLDYADGMVANVSVEVTRAVRGFALLTAIPSAIASAENASRLPRGWLRWSLVPEPVRLDHALVEMLPGAAQQQLETLR